MEDQPPEAAEGGQSPQKTATGGKKFSITPKGGGTKTGIKRPDQTGQAPAMSQAPAESPVQMATAYESDEAPAGGSGFMKPFIMGAGAGFVLGALVILVVMALLGKLS